MCPFSAEELLYLKIMQGFLQSQPCSSFPQGNSPAERGKRDARRLPARPPIRRNLNIQRPFSFPPPFLTQLSAPSFSLRRLLIASLPADCCQPSQTARCTDRVGGEKKLPFLHSKVFSSRRQTSHLFQTEWRRNQAGPSRSYDALAGEEVLCIPRDHAYKPSRNDSGPPFPPNEIHPTPSSLKASSNHDSADADGRGRMNRVYRLRRRKRVAARRPLTQVVFTESIGSILPPPREKRKKDLGETKVPFFFLHLT